MYVSCDGDKYIIVIKNYNIYIYIYFGKGDNEFVVLI